jgi:glycosyltransferase involved in cell wall biosynthesis
MKPTIEQTEQVEISVVVPVYNEEENLSVLIPKIVRVFNEVGLPYEMIFVDDGSSDGSLKVLKETASLFPHLRIIKLKQNRGLSTALLAGMKETQGERIVTLDADLQNPRISRNFLISRPIRHGDGMAPEKRRPVVEKIFHNCQCHSEPLSGEEIRDSACTLRAFKGNVQDIPVFNGMHRFLSTLVKMEGYRIIEVPVIHHPRKFGMSKYNIRNRMVRTFIDLLAVRWMKSRLIGYEIEERV